ncbi:putative OmpL-like beta-barrel porin-2 [Chitinophaga skermanii]|uniref:Putative OmpL-like beta-barrel porin-2 n=1 Tax=Chitinophaga skermanii TaxID=331697 RepID=A0A327QBH9_9BACT|nr:porin [Chitinophaga skermanii]RAJ01641.1 putative OmpL-like beta-barrel porin-2 [Chitinophaga skermanii]
MKKVLIGAALLMASSATFAQEKDSTASLTFSGYVEAYYGYDFLRPSDHNRPGFIYSHNRHNEVNINLAFIKANYTSDRVRGNLALMAGTYAQANYAAESSIMQHVYEANVGVRVAKNLWLDAGVMPSHIGFESAVSKDCYTLTRSIMAENTPYYEAGAKLTYNPNDKWAFSVMYLNGWQRIKRVDGNQTPGVGSQVVFKPSSNVTLNWSTFIGNDKPDTVRQMRYFNNVYGIFNITNKFSVIAGMDYGMEQTAKGSSDYNKWYSPIVIARYALPGNFAIAGRMEYYKDENNVIISTPGNVGFETTGYSLNLDYAPIRNVLIRVEGKTFDSRQAIYSKYEKGLQKNAGLLTTSIAISF